MSKNVFRNLIYTSKKPPLIKGRLNGTFYYFVTTVTILSSTVTVAPVPNKRLKISSPT